MTFLRVGFGLCVPRDRKVNRKGDSRTDQILILCPSIDDDFPMFGHRYYFYLSKTFSRIRELPRMAIRKEIIEEHRQPLVQPRKHDGTSAIQDLPQGAILELLRALNDKGRMRTTETSHRLQLETCNNVFETQSHVTGPVTRRQIRCATEFRYQAWVRV